MSKAAIYCRLSEEDRNKKNEADDSGSIQNQKAMLLEYAAQHSWEVYDIYSDDNYTGSDRNRPAFTRMLEDAEVHRFDIILCKSQSRFTRELELVEKYINGLFPIWGIRFISLVDREQWICCGFFSGWYLMHRTIRWPRQRSGSFGIPTSLHRKNGNSLSSWKKSTGTPKWIRTAFSNLKTARSGSSSCAASASTL